MPTMTTTEGVKIAYRVAGTGRRTIVLIHGWMVSGAVYDALVERLDLTAVRLVIPDLRGAGESDKPASGYTIECYARDVIALMREFSDPSFVLVGHSMGGAIAQYIAATAPEWIAGLVLLCPVPASGIPFPADAAALFRGASDRASKATILGMACTNLSEADRDRLLDAGASIPAACLAEGFDAWAGADFAAELKEVRARTLVVATDDPFLPPAFLREAVVGRIGGARLAVIHGAGHYVQVERPDETAAVIEAFLAGLGT